MQRHLYLQAAAIVINNGLDIERIIAEL